MLRISRILVLLFTITAVAGVVCTRHEVAAQDKKKKKKKNDPDKKGAKKDDKKDDKKIEKKEEFKPDQPQTELKYLDKDKSYWVYDVEFSADGKRVAASYQDKAVRVWDIGAKKVTQTLKGPAKDARGLRDYKSIVFLKDIIFTGTGTWNKEKKSAQGEIRAWNVKDGKAGKPLQGHANAIEALSVSKDGKFLASASEDNTVLIWNLAQGKSTQTIKGHSDYVTSVAFSPDGKRLVTTSKDKTLRLWNVADGKELANFKVEREVEAKVTKGKGKGAKTVVTKTKELGREFTSALFTKDGNRVIAGNLDGVIKIYDLDGKKEMKELKAHEGVWALALSPDGSTFATGGWDGTIKIWNVADGKELRSIKAHLGIMPKTGGTVTAIDFSPNGQWLASGGIDGTVKIWSVK